jgi:hypothetical protein
MFIFHIELEREKSKKKIGKRIMETCFAVIDFFKMNSQ